jgi:hypothetical protein
MSHCRAERNKYLIGYYLNVSPRLEAGRDRGRTPRKKKEWKNTNTLKLVGSIKK